ncbi:SDR family oxidoreductase [Lichenihabitans sp. Uapishka_5]|uniref:SDR family oxidoreductase n=1 Tax=Lichenihabitans sp. Uapishka_5 TaxID=3037302 RepID=UPI0029E7EC22|nr:SDR family oxidoreductase [Lichenihabitans sp. Uapishka_5]MDX7951181.1 SDR family oxidoreductase [Lichenihabitans sp. Uapishka_5]
MIVVTGANGQLGRHVVDNLLRRIPADQIVASVREHSKADSLQAKGVAIRAGDFADPAALVDAFAGASQVLVISVNQLGEAALQLHRSAIEAAATAGVRRILYTAHMGARSDSPFMPARDHAATEAILAESGIPFTSLRHGFYAESALHMIGQGLAAGEIRAPEDGPVSWTARGDLAEADAILLAEPGLLDGITPPLTASEAVTMAELAAIASEVSGREIKRVVLSDDAWLDEKVAQGVPAPMAELLLGTFRASRRGDFASTDPTLERFLDRRPRSMRDVLAKTLKLAQA